MHLKSLVLKGFKSFADRSVITLEPGITAVVGPNGSGKSNISDAVLWVLGERNAKNLRGQAMEDVIFAGSSARRSVGVAEVDLVLDNTDATLPVDFTEVSLTRRMYRSGESEYLINGAPARRMDFMDILHDTGLGTGTHSIIGQGNLDAILASRPEDRRALVEEAAGVLKHKQRKDRSARKLAAMDAHLARVKDVAAEVERQLKPLARKAARAEAFHDVSAALSELELSLAVDDLRILQKRWDEAGLREKEAAAAIDIARLNADEAAAKVEKMQMLLQEKGIYVGDLTAQRGRFHMVLERLESNDRLLAEKERSIRARLDDARNTLAGSARRIERFQDEAAALQEKLDETVAGRDQAAADVEELVAACEAASAARARLDAELADMRSSLRQAERDTDAAQAERARLQDSIAGRLSAKGMLESKKAEMQAELAATREELERRARLLDEQATLLGELAERSRLAQQGLDRAQDEATAARGALDDARRSCQDIEGRIAALEALIRTAREKNDASAWVSAHARDIDEAVVSLASHIKAPRELEGVVERLLGDDVAALCARDARHAGDIVKALAAAGRAGTASVLIAGSDAPARRSDAPGRLLDRIEYSDCIASVMEALLGDVAIVDSVDEALARAQGHEGLRFATCDGVTVYPGAKIAFESAGDAHGGALARERELEQLRAELVQAHDALNAAEENLRRCDEQLESRRAASLELSQAHAQRKGANESERAEHERLAVRVGSLAASLEKAQAELVETTAALAAAEPRIGELSDALERHRARRGELDESIAHATAARDGAYAEEQSLQGRLSEAKLRRATASERIRSLEREHRARCADLDRAAKARARAAAEMRTLEAGAHRAGPLRALVSSLKESAQARIDDLAGKAALEQSSSAQLSSAIDQARTAARDARERLDAAQGALNEVRVEKGKLEVQVESAIAAIVDECGVSIESALEVPPPEDRAAAEAEAFRLRRKLKSIGTIDSSAAEEHAAMKERYEFLISQVEDVEAARRALKRIVAAIDERMKEQFDTTFERVDANFRSIFAQLFPGGSGSLSLVELDDEGKLGVEVHAQPRGKRITKMTLMSGGEKSLVAIALLFAVYSIRRTPFYILDEVEAALDDSNLRRLLAYLETLRHDTQLIMITHQRRTMELADVLYGVSMQGDGVTKVVSQRLDKASATAE